jgi:hypothetical protein
MFGETMKRADVSSMGRGINALACLLLLPQVSSAATFAAFIQPDPGTSQPPFEAIVIMRGANHTNTVDSHSPLQPCDQIKFVTSSTKVQRVLITTVQGGKNIQLDAGHPSADIPCEEVTLGAVARQLWKEISGGERATYSVSTLTRGDQFSLPILSSDRSNLVASGKRSLYIAWHGGTPPFRVVLRSASNGETIAKIDSLNANSARTPELDLQPGQYSLSVFNTPTDGSVPELRENNLFVVDASELPSPPAKLKAAKLDQAEAELLYVYYLEGQGDGRWAFEAMQRAAAINPATPASTDWLRRYGGGQ